MAENVAPLSFVALKQNSPQLLRSETSGDDDDKNSTELTGTLVSLQVLLLIEGLCIHVPNMPERQRPRSAVADGIWPLPLPSGRNCRQRCAPSAAFSSSSWLIPAQTQPPEREAVSS